MEQTWNERLNEITGSFSFFIPEIILAFFFLSLIAFGLFKPKLTLLIALSLICFAGTATFVILLGLDQQINLFNGMVRVDGLSSYLKILMDVTGLLTCLLSTRRSEQHASEYFALLIAVVLGGHLLVMSTNFLMIFLSLELISIGSYILAGYAFDKAGSEGALKYFLFGATASAIMLYGFSILYGLTGTIDFSSQQFFNQFLDKNSPLALFAALMVMAGFLYKIAAAPMHLWAPDVYQAAPVPVLAFLSVAPKMAGLGVLIKFVLAINLFGQSIYDWQLIMSAIAILTITIGNFSALMQQNAKRLMAYSSIAQSGFLLIGIAAFLPQGIHFLVFYATVYLLMNFLVFLYLDSFERRGITAVSDFSGAGKLFIWPCVFLVVGLVSLTGLPPTAGFSAKLFIFSALWQSYEITGKPLLMWLLVFGLLNTVVSLFYYLRIPYYAFLKSGETSENTGAFDKKSDQPRNILNFENLLGFILVLAILILFFRPGLLMGWINKINFVL